MKVSFDGLRRSLGSAYSSAVCAFRADDKEAMKDALEDLRGMIGALMCIYSENPSDLMSNMTEDALKLPWVEMESAKGDPA